MSYSSSSPYTQVNIPSSTRERIPKPGWMKNALATDRGTTPRATKDMILYTEGGPSYFNEDFRNLPDSSSFRARLSMKCDWPLFDGRITLYHYGEFFPSLQDLSDFYFTMDNGVRLKILGGLTSGLQVTTRYNNRPPADKLSTDNLYLFTLGYAFDTTRKR